MQQALPYKACHTTTNCMNQNQNQNLKSIVDENSLVVFGPRGCCMTHVVRRLLLGLGVNPTLYDIDDKDEPYLLDQLRNMGGADVVFPVVFVGGRWFGGLDRLIATHISGELTPLLREAGALWL